MTITDPIYEPWVYKPNPDSAFGPIISAFEVELAVADSVRRWMPDYLAELERRRGLEAGRMPAFRSIAVSAELQRMPEDQLPALLIASPGIEVSASAAAGRIEIHGDGGILARFRVDVAAVVSARGNRHGLRLARLYAAALRTLLVQQALQPTVLDLRRLDLTGERFDLLDADGDRTQGAGVVSIAVEVADVSNRLMGPLEPGLPPTEPGEPPEEMEWPIAQTTHVTVTKQEE